ncbi:MAG: hypothetical protein HC927_13010 [Deltaproteobacteria bacterium]|nr:hypothetical protein [Deltaproteobacteria bacterium]
MMTSRIKQAIASVQIFIHRVLLHLEPVTFDFEAVARWEWMKNYRVWEANRKVFLYPENWIEPELRSNKSPEFEGLEGALTQGLLDESRVRKALGGYLDQLERVSNLEIVGVYRHSGQAPDDLSLWLLARTQSDPRTWFVTQRRSTGEWQAWEEVPHQFDGHNVALVVREQRVHIFSLTIIDAAFMTANGSVVQDKPPGFRVTVGHLERAEDGWSAISLSEQSAVFPSPRGKLRLQVWNLETNVEILVLQRPADGNPSEVKVLCLFNYLPAYRHVRYEGAPNVSIPIDLIALQGSWGFEGQRYAWKAGLGTRYSLPPFDRELFAHAPDDGYRALVYEADTWMNGAENPGLWTNILNGRTPVVYDDRRRKYLLEIVPPGSGMDEPPRRRPETRPRILSTSARTMRRGIRPRRGPTKSPRGNSEMVSTCTCLGKVSSLVSTTVGSKPSTPWLCSRRRSTSSPATLPWSAKRIRHPSSWMSSPSTTPTPAT